MKKALEEELRRKRFNELSFYYQINSFNRHRKIQKLSTNYCRGIKNIPDHLTIF